MLIHIQTILLFFQESCLPNECDDWNRAHNFTISQEETNELDKILGRPLLVPQITNKRNPIYAFSQATNAKSKPWVNKLIIQETHEGHGNYKLLPKEILTAS